MIAYLKQKCKKNKENITNQLKLQLFLNKEQHILNSNKLKFND
jgi:hypothetical protein